MAEIKSPEHPLEVLPAMLNLVVRGSPCPARFASETDRCSSFKPENSSVTRTLSILERSA